MVQPHSFRNHLIRVLCYTAVVPIFMLGLFQLQQVQRAMQEADQVQLGWCRALPTVLSLTLKRRNGYCRWSLRGKPADFVV